MKNFISKILNKKNNKRPKNKAVFFWESSQMRKYQEAALQKQFDLIQKQKTNPKIASIIAKKRQQLEDDINNNYKSEVQQLTELLSS